MLTLLALASAAPLRAQLPGDPFAALVREGLASNRGLLQGRLGLGQRDLEVRRAKGSLLPTLDVNARWSEFEGIPGGAIAGPEARSKEVDL